MPSNHGYSSNNGCGILIIFALLIVGIIICVLWKFIFTPQWRAKHWGGTATVQLPAGRHLVNVTWKDDHLWMLTEQASPGSVPKTYEFNESSNMGILQGTVIIKEAQAETP